MLPVNSQRLQVRNFMVVAGVQSEISGSLQSESSDVPLFWIPCASLTFRFHPARTFLSYHLMLTRTVTRPGHDSGTPRLPTPGNSRQHCFDDVPVNVCQAIVATLMSIREPFVFDAEAVQDGGV